MSSNKSICKQLIKDYCLNCSFAGIHFIADETKHWSERTLWVVLVTLSWYGAALLIVAAWEAFVLSPISFGVETVYIDWDTPMPSVAICETANDPKRFDVSDTIWTPKHLPDLEDALKEVVYYRGVSRVLLRTCYHKPKPDPNCFFSNFSYYANLVRSDCKDFIKNCSYNDVPFPCCEYFLPIETDIGPCFIINSVQTRKQQPYPMVKNLKNQQGAIKFDVTITSSVYTIGEDEVPTITTSLSSYQRAQPGSNYRRILSVRHIENDPLIWETSTKQRACRFHDENEGGLYPKYSYSACTVLCRKQAQLDKCKCNDHFMLNTSESQRCNISGMACLNSMTNTLTTLKPPWAHRPGLSCNCLPSCDETEITLVSVTSIKSTRRDIASVEISLAYLPTERFKRNVVRSRLDLVVSVGGTAGLFVGASILSFVELFFFFTIRLFNNLCINRKRNRNENSTIVKSNNGPVTENLEDINKKFQKMENDLRHVFYRKGNENSNYYVVKPYQN